MTMPALLQDFESEATEDIDAIADKNNPAAETVTEISTDDVPQHVSPSKHAQDIKIVDGVDTAVEALATAVKSDPRPAAGLTGSSCTVSLDEGSQVSDSVCFYVLL